MEDKPNFRDPSVRKVGHIGLVSRCHISHVCPHLIIFYPHFYRKKLAQIQFLITAWATKNTLNYMAISTCIRQADLVNFSVFIKYIRESAIEDPTLPILSHVQ